MKSLNLSNYPKTRLAIYLLGIGAQVVSFFVAVYAPELAQAFSQTADVLGVIAIGTAAANLDTDVISKFDQYHPESVPASTTVLTEGVPDDGAEPTASGSEPRHAE